MAASTVSVVALLAGSTPRLTEVACAPRWIAELVES
jgi:hypothetical protein